MTPDSIEMAEKILKDYMASVVFQAKKLADFQAEEALTSPNSGEFPKDVISLEHILASLEMGDECAKGIFFLKRFPEFYFEGTYGIYKRKPVKLYSHRSDCEEILVCNSF